MEVTEPCPSPIRKPQCKKLMEIANAVEAVQDGRIFIELVNGPFLFEYKRQPDRKWR